MQRNITPTLLQVSVCQKTPSGANFIQLAQRFAATTGRITVLAVHAIALVVDALHVLVDALDDFLGVLGGQQTFLHHVLHRVGLLGQDQRGRLLRADGSHSLGVDILQTTARDGNLEYNN